MPPTPPIEAPSDIGEPTRTSLIRQLWTIVRRQTRLIVSDRGYFAFLALLTTPLLAAGAVLSLMRLLDGSSDLPPGADAAPPETQWMLP